MCDLILLYIEKLQNGTAMRTVQEFCSIRLNENSRTVEIVVFQYFFRSSLGGDWRIVSTGINQVQVFIVLSKTTICIISC